MKILILANHDVGLYNFRKELIEALLKNDNEVYIVLPEGKKVRDLIYLGCRFVNVSVDRRGTNPFKDLYLLYQYVKILHKIKPHCILTYTIKPNIYGSIAAAILNIPVINNITGLGSILNSSKFLAKGVKFLYKIALRKSKHLFFQNAENLRWCIEAGFCQNNYSLIPGSGVNLLQHKLEEYPPIKEQLCFLFIGRIMKDKGIEEYVEAAKRILSKYKGVEFHVIGDYEDNYQKYIEQLHQERIIIYDGFQQNIHEFIKKAHCIVHPSYHEGMSNVLLEAAASGRPMIASRIPGCQEIFDEGLSGYGFTVKNIEEMVQKIECFIQLDDKSKKNMGLVSRKKMEKEFDRNIVIDAYMTAIQQSIHS